MSGPTFNGLLRDVIHELGWAEDANCKNMDLDLFFPEIGENINRFTQEVCNECLVRLECLWYANETSTEFGVYGGMSPRNRYQWRKMNGIQLGQSYADWVEHGR